MGLSICHALPTKPLQSAPQEPLWVQLGQPPVVPGLGVQVPASRLPLLSLAPGFHLEPPHQ